MKLLPNILTLVAIAETVFISKNDKDFEKFSKTKAEKEARQKQKFAGWAAKFNKSFKNVKDREKRFKAWKEKDDAYEELNSDTMNTFTVGHNALSDLTEEEIRALSDGNILDDSMVEEWNTVVEPALPFWIDPTITSPTNPDNVLAQTEQCSCPTYSCGKPTYCQQCHDFGLGKATKLYDWRDGNYNNAKLSANIAISD